MNRAIPRVVVVVGLAAALAFPGAGNLGAQGGSLKAGPGAKAAMIPLRIILAGPEGSPQPPGAALVKVWSPAATRERSVVQRACTNTTGSQQPPANAVSADASGVCTLRFPPGTVLRLSATTDQGWVPGSGGGGYPPAPINGQFTAFEGCQPDAHSKRHCTLKLPASGEAQVKALFSR